MLYSMRTRKPARQNGRFKKTCFIRFFLPGFLKPLQIPEQLNVQFDEGSREKPSDGNLRQAFFGTVNKKDRFKPAGN